MKTKEGAQQGLGALQRADILLHEGHRLQAALHNHTVGTVIVHGVFRISYSNRLLYKIKHCDLPFFRKAGLKICIFLRDSFHRGRSHPALFSIYILAYIFDIFNIFMLFYQNIFWRSKNSFLSFAKAFFHKKHSLSAQQLFQSCKHSEKALC